MKKALTLTALAASTFLLPLVSLAAINNVSDVGSFIINTIHGVIVPVLFAIAFIVFLWGAFRTFILGANDADAKKNGTNLMLYGLIGFFVMVSVWGLVNILVNTAGLSGQGPAVVPKAGVQVGR